MEEELILDDPGQLQALGHPLRQRILGLLAEEPRTNKQLAGILGEQPGRLHFHVRQLEQVGLIRIVEQRPKRGVMEKYYGLVARSFRLGELLPATMAQTSVGETALIAAQQELARAEREDDTPLELEIMHERVALTPAQRSRISVLLAELRAVMATSGPPDDATQEAPAYVMTFLMHRAAG